MKFFSLFGLILVLGVSIVCANPRQKAGGVKITKNEAEHIALKNYQGARVTTAKLETIRERKIWVIEIAQRDQRSLVEIDAMTGRIVPAKESP